MVYRPPSWSLFELLEPEELAMLVRADLLAKDFRPDRPVEISDEERVWLQREARKRPTGRYARYLSGGPLPP